MKNLILSTVLLIPLTSFAQTKQKDAKDCPQELEGAESQNSIETFAKEFNRLGEKIDRGSQDGDRGPQDGQRAQRDENGIKGEDGDRGLQAYEKGERGENGKRGERAPRDGERAPRDGEKEKNR